MRAIERLVGGGIAGARALADPTRADQVARLSELSPGVYCALSRMRDRIAITHTGQALLRNRHRITSNSVCLETLASLDPCTFGFAYAKFMIQNNFRVDSRLDVENIADGELAYVLQRYREQHDLYHVLLGIPDVSVLAEVAQKHFEALQTGLPMCIISSLAGPMRLSFRELTVLYTRLVPWAIECNFRCKFLLAEPLEQYFNMPLEEVRRELGIIVAPSVFTVN